MTGNIVHSTSSALGVALIIGASEFLAGDRPVLISGLTVVASSVLTFAWTYLISFRYSAPPKGESPNIGANAPQNRIAHRTLHRINLATEHLGSLLIVLRIAREYNQPVPTGVLHNLTLVDKELRSLQHGLEEHLMRGEKTLPTTGRKRTPMDVLSHLLVVAD